MRTDNYITVALDGTGGDNVDPQSVASAVRFATVFEPKLKVIVYGDKKLQTALESQKISPDRYQFEYAPVVIAQDEEPRKVISGFLNSAMRLAIEAVKDKKASVAVSSGGTGPLVCLSRHILGVIDSVRPALCAKIPAGPGRYSLMLDLGANALSGSEDMYEFALLGSAAYKSMFNTDRPRVSILNVGTERNKGSAKVKEARDLVESNSKINFVGFVEANNMFCDYADVIVTDGFTGNVALKAAEGVASVFLNAHGIKKFFSMLARPDWLEPWQYNGSMLLGVDGLVVKSHASSGKEAVAVALVQAYKLARQNIVENIKNELKKA